ncbi:NUAK family SNF1-like kinase 1 [Toxocara canis]|uniref:NUAK family SNF1-like kinase 1 n=1 Tax=Toxocara canis TaxID=6265 RepID=A0A0B2V0D8_TOXCA|nr:NUAK family SNF1-like kinase 1 [Toxocara canis]
MKLVERRVHCFVHDGAQLLHIFAAARTGEVPQSSSGGMTIGAGGGGGSRSNSRNSRTNKYSTSKLRNSQHGSGVAGGGSALGGQPLNGPGMGAGKGDIKQRFEIIRKLGSGTYGKVSLAYDHKNEREVAVKLIKKSAIENKQDLVRIRREIRIMSALKHPNIIQIFEVFENRDKIILVMEYASGGELYDYVSTYGSLPEPEARRIFRQITSAVLYCHKHKVAHRDLKLENILLDADNNAKIADFGLSNYFSDKSLLSTFCGSPLYASPEIINGTPYRGPEVDCWSLGILLYTLVYGSMPFDGRDFNRMVRQIKRGAYFEPDTPSTASMLIRNMLRVNPERRADIDDIASHWWLNLEENMPVIQELPENQIVDFTPLTERAETMVVQDLADETDVFMDFGHLSASTRKKIEEFRRRRKEAEEYNENSPIKPPKARKTDGYGERPEMLSVEKSLRHDVVVKKEETLRDDLKDDFNDPLERLKRLESRLQTTPKENRSPDRNPLTSPVHREKDVYRARQPTVNEGHPYSRTSEKKPLEFSKSKELKDARMTPEQPDDPTTSSSRVSQQAAMHADAGETKKPLFVPLDVENSLTKQPYRKTSTGKQVNTWRMETDSLNMLMNQVLEQMESGPVSMNLIARIKAHPFYDTRPMVKELLESIIAAQPPSVQKQASKLIQQQSQELVRRQQSGSVQKRLEKDTSNAVATTQRTECGIGNAASKKYQVPEIPQRPGTKASQKVALEERPWHSVEVGFDPDEESEHIDSNVQHAIRTNTTEETVHDTSFEDESEEKNTISEGGKSVGSTRKATLSKKDTIEEIEEMAEEAMGEEESEQEEEEAEEEDDEEQYNTEIDELGNEVEQVEEEEDNVSYASAVSQQNSEHPSENAPPPDPQVQGSAPKFIDTFDRCLAKRQSKGKYQASHNKVELYGRGVSTECESPTFSHRRIGGPQPTIERSPFLFDKAKKYIMTYPKQMDDSDDDLPGRLGRKNVGQAKKNWLKTQDPDVMGSSMENASQSVTPTARIKQIVDSRDWISKSRESGLLDMTPWGRDDSSALATVMV